MGTLKQRKAQKKQRQSNSTPETIWVLDDTESLFDSVKESIGSQFRYKLFCDLDSFCEALRKRTKGPLAPSLLICDAQVNGSYLPEFHDKLPPNLPPVVIISDYNDGALIAACLEMGVKDYLLKPVDPSILVAKVMLHIRSNHKSETENVVGLTFDLFSLAVTNDAGARIRLTLKEYQILNSLAKAYPDGLSPSKLREKVWGTLKVVPKALDVHLFKLRRKLGALDCHVRFDETEKYTLVKG